MGRRPTRRFPGNPSGGGPMSEGMLTCPKCHGAMRSYERSGVTVDQCGECRGIFLDRGELDHLIDAERNWHSDTPIQREAVCQCCLDDRARGGSPLKRQVGFPEEVWVCRCSVLGGQVAGEV